MKSYGAGVGIATCQCNGLGQLQGRARRRILLVDVMCLGDFDAEGRAQGRGRVPHRALQHGDTEAHISVVDDRHGTGRFAQGAHLSLVEAADPAYQRHPVTRHGRENEFRARWQTKVHDDIGYGHELIDRVAARPYPREREFRRPGDSARDRLTHAPCPGNAYA